jgi:heme oxygenase (biliverdin-IX-beta and delta-forming)
LKPSPSPSSVPPALARIRAATAALHHHLEKLDVIGRLSEPFSRANMICRYAALHVPAHPALTPHLHNIDGLDLPVRSRAAALAPRVIGSLPPFPAPRNRAEALGMLYVLEGSTLGGRVILRTLLDRGVDDPSLSFLDPYGEATGKRWRDFIAVLTRELGSDAALVTSACTGAVRAFRHAGSVLGGDSV